MIRTSACVSILAFTLAAAGCGEDEEKPAVEAPAAEVVTTDEGATAELPASTSPQGEAEAEAPTSPEEQEGGAGDEEAARSEVELEFSSQGLEPPIVRVAPFIAVKLIVRSIDGSEYDLTVSGPREGAGANGTTETDLDLEGLRPGQKYEVRERNTGSVTAIVASDAVGP